MKTRIIFITFILISLTALSGFAQSFSNSWINFNNTYFKFKITQEGLYRISKAKLDSLGMGSVPGNQFAIFREGEEVALRTTTTGTFGNNDYLEFYATKANGKIDKALYPDPTFQPNDEVNLLSDTANYFLTFDAGSHLRYQEINNSIPVPNPSPASYCWSTVYPNSNNRAAFRPGKSHSINEYFYSNDFDIGEGFSYYTTTFNFQTYEAALTSGQSPQLSFVTSGTSIAVPQNTTNLKVEGITVFDTSYTGYFQLLKKTIDFPITNLGTSSSTVQASGTPSLAYFKMTLRYPRTFSFSNDFTNQARFVLPANEHYLEITNFNTSGGVPDLFDLSNNRVYKGIYEGNKLKYQLNPSSSERILFLKTTNQIPTIVNFESVQFRNYASIANQGDYIILSHKNYIQATPNYLNDYKNYRASLSGGGYQPVIVDVTELYNQFGYGYDFHAIAIKNFIAFAYQTWSPQPRFLYIVGKGIGYPSYMSYLVNPGLYSYSPVPTWGDPGSDNLFSSFNNSQKPVLATGRLSAWNNQEIGAYLEKVKSYEAALKFSGVPTVANDFWKKKGLHVAGSANAVFQQTLLQSLNETKNIYTDTLIGGSITTIAKNSTDPIDNNTNVVIDSMMNEGLGIINFYGHASSSGFDYNLNNPDNYHSNPRFPNFFAFGCDVAHIFTLTQNKTISEQYIQSVNGGSISMIASDNYGYTHILPIYMKGFYQNFSYKTYGKTLGEQYQKNIEELITYSPSSMMNIHTQSLLFIGDPALKIFNPEKPDYAVETNGLSTFPVNVSSSLDSFELKAIIYNLGKATNDSVWVRIDHRLQGENTILNSDSVLVARLFNSDTIKFKLPINPNRDVGLNNYTITLDPQNQFDEISKQNNSASIQVFIYSNNISLIYPYENSIMHTQDITLKMSILNAFAPTRNYRIEIDTTEKFNSLLKQSIVISQSGGVVKWKPTLMYRDSTVYYWRAAVDSLMENNEIKWTNSSFIYLQNGSDGWNQSHYFQFAKNELNGLQISETNRDFRFNSRTNYFQVENKVVNPLLADYHNVRQTLNDVVIDNWGCGYTGALQIVVIDSVTGQPWSNGTGLFGSIANCSHFAFEFFTSTLANRNLAKDFIENVPQGNYIMIKNIIHGGPPGPEWDRQGINEWMEDTLVNGSGNSLYHTIKNIGFNEIDQYTSKKVFAFFRKKGNDVYPVYQVVAPDSTAKIQLFASFLSYPDTGILKSTIIGPSVQWDSLLWKAVATDNFPQNDSPFVKVFGIDVQNVETELYSGSETALPLSFINASQYPRLRLNWYGVDNVTRTSPNLKYWRILYQPVPEAALNAHAYFQFKDSLHQGQEGNLKFAIENLSPYPMDSMLVKFKMIDAQNISHDYGQKRYRPLPANDTLIAEFPINADAYPGLNSLMIEINPNRDQPEQYHPNNLGFLNLHVQSDATNPVLDVTFDGIHILNKDIVSSKPFIKAALKDENKFLALNDSSLLTIHLLKPNNTTPEFIPIDGTICKFIPAQIVNGKTNTAFIEYRPTLSEDGVYRLIVEGKDKSGNAAGNKAKYVVDFTVENKPSITNLLNYPNPFSTSTQFVFTMTGSEIPSQFKIQILTVTGKVVKEITKGELGTLRIGRNITDYRWDGKDQYGQLLGNGVYLYRVITSLHGNSIEHRKNTTVDQYFKNGFGKLYIMR